MWLILLDLDNLCGFLLLVTSIDHRNDGLGEIDESLTCNGVDMTGCRFAFVAAFTDTLHERNLGEQWGLHLLGESLAAFLSKDVIVGCKSTKKILKSFVKSEKDYTTLLILTLFN